MFIMLGDILQSEELVPKVFESDVALRDQQMRMNLVICAKELDLHQS